MFTGFAVHTRLEVGQRWDRRQIKNIQQALVHNNRHKHNNNNNLDPSIHPSTFHLSILNFTPRPAVPTVPLIFRSHVFSKREPTDRATTARRNIETSVFCRDTVGGGTPRISTIHKHLQGNDLRKHQPRPACKQMASRTGTDGAWWDDLGRFRKHGKALRKDLTGFDENGQPERTRNRKDGASMGENETDERGDGDSGRNETSVLWTIQANTWRGWLTIDEGHDESTMRELYVSARDRGGRWRLVKSTVEIIDTHGTSGGQ